MTLVLRPWLLSDAPEVLAAFGSEDMSTQAADAVRTLDDAIAWIESAGVIDARSAAFAVELDARLAGNVMVSDIDHRHDTGWVSYWTTAASRGRGVATAATATLAHWAFDELGLFRLELGHRVGNPPSCRVATAAGFVAEGIERAKLRYGAERFDVHTHARLASDPVPAVPPVKVVPP